MMGLGCLYRASDGVDTSFERYLSTYFCCGDQYYFLNALGETALTSSSDCLGPLDAASAYDIYIGAYQSQLATERVLLIP